jgi:hypothetical protein
MVRITPFDIAASEFEELRRSLDKAEMLATKLLPGIPWNFSALRNHLDEVAGLVRSGLGLKACKLHEEFAVAPPGRLMAKLRRKKAEHAARVWATEAGSAVSAKKTSSLRLNVERARDAKKRKRQALPNDAKEALKDMKVLRRVIRNLKYREKRQAKIRALQPNKRSPRKDFGLRARRREQAELKLKAMEAAWRSFRMGDLGDRLSSTDGWLIAPTP